MPGGCTGTILHGFRSACCRIALLTTATPTHRVSRGAGHELFPAGSPALHHTVCCVPHPERWRAHPRDLGRVGGAGHPVPVPHIQRRVRVCWVHLERSHVDCDGGQGRCAMLRAAPVETHCTHALSFNLMVAAPKGLSTCCSTSSRPSGRL